MRSLVLELWRDLPALTSMAVAGDLDFSEDIVGCLAACRLDWYYSASLENCARKLAGCGKAASSCTRADIVDTPM